MKALPLLYLLLIAILFGCSEDEVVSPSLSDFPAPVLRIEAPETAAVGESVAVKVFFQVNNGCGEFGSFQENRNGHIITVQVYPHYQGQACYQALMTLEAFYTFKPEKAGTYTLNFWSGEDTYITDTIVVQ